MNPSDVSVLAGEVIDTSRLSHTEVWSSDGGGGGYVGPYGGNVSVSAPRVHSQATTNTDIFLRDKQGKEHHVRVCDSDIPLRPGHQIELAYVKTGRDWELAVLHNHSTDKYWELDCARVGIGRAYLSAILLLISIGLGLISIVVFVGALITIAGNMVDHLQSHWITKLMPFGSVIGWGVAKGLNAMGRSLRFGPQEHAHQKAKHALGLRSKDFARAPA